MDRIARPSDAGNAPAGENRTGWPRKMRDGEQDPFTRVPFVYILAWPHITIASRIDGREQRIPLGSRAFHVFCALKSYCYNNKTICFPKPSAIMARVGIRKSQLYEALNRLLAAGVATIEPDGSYYFPESSDVIARLFPDGFPGNRNVGFSGKPETDSGNSETVSGIPERKSKGGRPRKRAVAALGAPEAKRQVAKSNHANSEATKQPPPTPLRGAGERLFSSLTELVRRWAMDAHRVALSKRELRAVEEHLSAYPEAERHEQARTLALAYEALKEKYSDPDAPDYWREGNVSFARAICNIDTLKCDIDERLERQRAAAAAAAQAKAKAAAEAERARQEAERLEREKRECEAKGERHISQLLGDRDAFEKWLEAALRAKGWPRPVLLRSEAHSAVLELLRGHSLPTLQERAHKLLSAANKPTTAHSWVVNTLVPAMSPKPT